MKSTLKFVTPWLAAAAIGGAIALAPVAAAATQAAPTATTSAVAAPGTDPQVPQRLGYIDSNHDEANTTNGQVDLPF